MKKHEINVAVVGVGSMGKNHARVYSEIANLIAVADINEKQGKEVAERLGVMWYKDYHDLLNMNIDAVSIAVPTKYHYTVAKDFIDHGKHVLVEKPLCLDMEEAENLVSLAKSAGIVLAVGFIERHNPVVRFVKEGLRNKKLGKIISASSRRVSSFPSRIRDVGVILDLAVHDIDIMRYLVGSDVVSVYTVGGRNGESAYETHASITLKFRNGVVGYVEANWLTPMKVRKLWLTCTQNYVEIDYIKQSVRVSEARVMEHDSMDLFRVPFEYNIREFSLKKEEPLKNELHDFLGAIEEKRRPLVSGEDAVKTMAVAFSAIESLNTGEVVEIDSRT